MKYSSAFYYAVATISVATALPSVSRARQAGCSSPEIRKSWNDANDAERGAYLDAAVCLTTKPSRLGHTGTTIHDDFAWVHNKLFRDIHGVAAFLPWHRLFVQAYEAALRTECGYPGSAMYWDWVRDSAAPSLASVWDPVTGFGGNGSSTDGSFCVRDGPFANLQLAYWNNDTTPHCLKRQWLDVQGPTPEMLGIAYSQAIVTDVFTNTDFLSFHGSLESRPHAAVHAGISGYNGDMGPATSPNDPIFFLHHTQVDRLWWLWQQESETRVYDYAGNVDPDYLGDLDATLDDTLELLGLGPDRTVREMMDAGSSDLCYGY
ncbi:hypothetical protein B0I35DRAFT_454600 [Stachybotrys elegans]|uniref:Tyrosinase copper-binding domain-containing protein n=1 Tax=Stachybotrys elegans TaxID=80388 RepID=A0A8K0SDU2_9HYPO|nr:hypothetical protein B0I35DRAFT_454600 [Stachybotrys elegans]